MYRQVENGYRLPAPANCPKAVHDLMLRCWQLDRRSRPQFSELHTEVAALRERAKAGDPLKDSGGAQLAAPAPVAPSRSKRASQQLTNSHTPSRTPSYLECEPSPVTQPTAEQLANYDQPRSDQTAYEDPQDSLAAPVMRQQPAEYQVAQQEYDDPQDTLGAPPVSQEPEYQVAQQEYDDPQDSLGAPVAAPRSPRPSSR